MTTSKPKRQTILSLCLSGHGFSGAVFVDGQVRCATTLERLTREKYDICVPISNVDLQTFGWTGNPTTYQQATTLPFDLGVDYTNLSFNHIPKFKQLMEYLLTGSGVLLQDVDAVAYSYRHTKAARAYFAEHAPQAEFIDCHEHHLMHACQAYLPSGFHDAAILVLDGQGVPLSRTDGDQLSGCLAWGLGDEIVMLDELPVRHSVGAMYAAFTHHLGFATNEDGKTMGLAPYGDSTYYDQLAPQLKFDAYESPRAILSGLLKQRRWPKRLHYQLPRYWELLGQTSLNREALAYAAQRLTEDVMVHLAKWLRQRTGSDNLCIAGGVGLNCVANAKVLEQAGFKHIFIHPSAGDNGLVIGQALYVQTQHWHQHCTYICTTDALGKVYTELRMRDAVEACREGYHKAEYFEWASLYLTVASAIAEGKIVAWFQGGSEFGPRALGQRSILADPRNPKMKDILNSRVKHREAFRPFTPSVLADKAKDYFDLYEPSSFMLLAPLAYKQQAIPAVVHVDGTARVQTVTPIANEHYYNLIQVFEKLTGVPMVLNTSFNVAGEPMVETPEDAVSCFQSTDIDVLCMGQFVLSKVDLTSKL